MQRTCISTIVVLFLGLCAAVSANAQVGPDVEDPWSSAREHYAAGEFQESIPYIVEAIQRDPLAGRYYISLARAHFQAGSFDLAVYYYQRYIDEFADTVDPDDDMYGAERAAAERDSANALRPNPEEAVMSPQAHADVRRSLLERLVVEPALTDSGGGIVATFRSLLRLGYAEPDLATLRQNVQEALLAEANRQVAANRPRLPQLSLEGWETQRERYRLSHRLIPDPPEAPRSTPSALLSRELLCEAQIQYLNQNFDSAADVFGRAIEADARLMPAYIGYINSIAAMDADPQQLDAAIRRFSATVDPRDPESAAVLDVYRAIHATRDGRVADAAARIRSLLDSQ